MYYLTLLNLVFSSSRNQLIDLKYKSIDWFPYDTSISLKLLLMLYIPHFPTLSAMDLDRGALYWQAFTAFRIKITDGLL